MFQFSNVASLHPLNQLKIFVREFFITISACVCYLHVWDKCKILLHFNHMRRYLQMAFLGSECSRLLWNFPANVMKVPWKYCKVAWKKFGPIFSVKFFDKSLKMTSFENVHKQSLLGFSGPKTFWSMVTQAMFVKQSMYNRILIDYTTNCTSTNAQTKTKLKP